MQIFKLYYKILFRAMLIPVLMYIVLFSIVSIISSNTGSSSVDSMFNMKKCKVAVIDYDNSVLSNNLTEYIDSNCKSVTLSEYDKNNLKDFLFFRRVEYICIIPQGFEDKFLDNNSLKIETMRIPNSTSGELVDTYINKYLNTLKIYANVDGISIEDANKNTLADLKIDTKVSINGDLTTKSIDNETQSGLVNYFNYYSYPLLAIMILCISYLSLVFNDMNLMRRNNCSPLSTSKISMQTLLGNLTIAIFVFVIFYIIGLVLYKESIFTKSGQIVVLNAFIFTIVCLNLGYMISLLVNKNTVSMLSNTISLGSCFLGGVFVPQSLLSDTVKNISLINPTFWYVKANNAISNISVYNYETMKPIIFSMLVEVCFAIVFFAISLIIIKRKRIIEQ